MMPVLTPVPYFSGRMNPQFSSKPSSVSLPTPPMASDVPAGPKKKGLGLFESAAIGFFLSVLATSFAAFSGSTVESGIREFQTNQKTEAAFDYRRDCVGKMDNPNDFEQCIDEGLNSDNEFTRKWAYWMFPVSKRPEAEKLDILIDALSTETSQASREIIYDSINKLELGNQQKYEALKDLLDQEEHAELRSWVELYLSAVESGL